jgi:cell division protein FtsI/penicillin-binding protein 2
MPAVRIKDHWREQRLFDQRSLICAVLMGLATAGLIVRLAVLQVVRHDYYAELSQGNGVRTEPIPAARGLILDRNGDVIAGDQPAYQLELVPEEVPHVAQTLASLVQLDLIRADEVHEIERTIASSFPVSTSRRARRASTRTARSPCMRSATSAPSAGRTSSTSIAPPTPAPR